MRSQVPAGNAKNSSGVPDPVAVENPTGGLTGSSSITLSAKKVSKGCPELPAPGLRSEAGGDRFDFERQPAVATMRRGLAGHAALGRPEVDRQADETVVDHHNATVHGAATSPCRKYPRRMFVPPLPARQAAVRSCVSVSLDSLEMPSFSGDDPSETKVKRKRGTPQTTQTAGGLATVRRGCAIGRWSAGSEKRHTR